MARRIIYSPAEMLQAATPFYDNMIGIINDQTNRIQRNQLKKEEAAAIVDQRKFEEGLVNKRLQAQRELQDDSQAFQEEQSKFQSFQNAREFDELMDWRWAQLDQQKAQEQAARVKAAQKQFQDELGARQKRINGIYGDLKKGGWLSTEAPDMYHVGWDGQNFTVEDQRNNRSFGFDEWIGRQEPLLGIQNALSGGQNLLDWIDENTYDSRNDFGGLSYQTGENQLIEDTVVDGEGNIGLGRDALRTAFVQVRDGLDFDGKALDLLTNVADQDSQYFVLEKEDDLTEFDAQQVAADVGTVRSTLSGLESFYANLIDPSTKQFNFDGEELEALIPNPVDLSSANILGGSDAVYSGKTIGEMRRAQYQLKYQFGEAETGTGVRNLQDPQYESISQAITTLENMAVSTINEYKDSMGIPEGIRDKPITFLAKIAKINKEQYMSDRPNPVKLFDFSYLTKDEISNLSGMNEQELMQQKLYEGREKEQAIKDLTDKGRYFYTIPGLNKN